MKLTVNAPLRERFRINVYVMLDAVLFVTDDGDTNTFTAAAPVGSTVRVNDFEATATWLLSRIWTVNE